MPSILTSPVKSLIAGLALAGVVLLLWLTLAGADRLGLASFLLRFVHVLTAMLWIGLLWFVNFIQLPALAAATDAERAAIARHIAPRVATAVRHASHGTVVSGLLLLVSAGYLLDRLMFSSAVYIPPLRNWLLWGGVAAGLAMWTLVHMVVWPTLRTMLAAQTDETARAAARERVTTYVRINLILAMPVVFVMVAAAHLY